IRLVVDVRANNSMQRTAIRAAADAGRDRIEGVNNDSRFFAREIRDAVDSGDRRDGEEGMWSHNRLKLTARGRPSADARQYRQPEPLLARGGSAAART
ncbi:MAG: hypothetical protein AAB297_01385, partial [Acidobacteriota bacterium]